MPAPISTSNSRFILESHDLTGKFVASLPYRNAQSEWALNDKGSQLRIDIPYRGYTQINRSNLWEAKHELWLFDRTISSSNPIFAGPVWDITASSEQAVLSCSAQDATSYFTKRVLKASKIYNNTQAADKIQDLVNYMNAVRALNLAVTKVKSNTQTSSLRYKSIDRGRISDLIADIAAQDDGVEYYCRVVNGVHTLFIYGGLIAPTTPQNNVLEYGGTLDGYSVQYNAQSIANDYDVVSNNGRVGNAKDTTKITEYNALYQQADIGSEQTSSTELTQTATKDLKDTKSSKTIPTLVTRKLTPIKDFNFGSQFRVVIRDGYVQVNTVIRVVGWQLTINQGDDITTVIYTKDTEGVS